MEFLYGKIEARIKMPTGSGTWPAFWTVGINRETIGWPACGEIDIMEWLGSAPQYIFGSLHKGNSSNKDNPLIRPYMADSVNVNGLSENFHVYGIEWDSTQIRFYCDTTSYVTYKDKEMDAAEWAQFTKPHYLLLNLAMGGKSGGIIDSTKFPFTYTVDYVRYYRKEK
jgi:beta-glucanase (GH16 family)